MASIRQNARSMVMAAILLVFLSSSVSAHMLWINLYEGSNYPVRHIVASLGYGHTIPMDDLLTTKGAECSLATYELIGPGGKRVQLPMPSIEPKKIETISGITMHCGDIGVRKLDLSDKTNPGTYQVVATSKSDFYTFYEDEKGKRKWDFKPMNEIEGARKIIQSVNYKTSAKAFFSVQNWTDPKPIGIDLEIIPITDLTNIRVGDVVQFQINFMGNPFSSKPDKREYITAVSNSFGGPDDFFLSAIIYRGKAQFRMPAAGQWVVSVGIMEEVTSEDNFKELVGKCSSVGYVTTISFNVRP